MIRRFLNDITPAPVEPRMYRTDTWGYGTRLPFDHHEMIAAIAPIAIAAAKRSMEAVLVPVIERRL